MVSTEHLDYVKHLVKIFLILKCFKKVMPDDFSYRLHFYPGQWSSSYAGLWPTSNVSVGLSFN